MAERKTIAGSITVSTIEDGLTYTVECDMESLIIASDATGTVASPKFSFYQRQGTGAREAVTLYYSAYLRYKNNANATAYTTLSKTGSGTSVIVSITSNTIDTSLRNYQALVLFCNTSANPTASNFLVKKELPIISNGNTGAQGKTGRNYYYAGLWSEVSGTSFVATDYMAPYVNAGTDKAPNCYIYVGKNGTVAYPTSQSGYTGASTSEWESMTTDFKYLITRALFSAYAQLGSAIFNEDFMFSQHGTLVGYGGVECPVSSGDSYAYADASDMEGLSASRTFNLASATSISYYSASAWSNTYRLNLGTLAAGMYVISASGAVSNRALAWKIGTSATTEIISSTIAANTGAFSFADSFEVTTSGTYYLYYKKTASGGTNPVVNSLMVSVAKFRPNTYINFLTGLMRSRNAFFKDVTIEGVINNLVNVIDDNNYSDYVLTSDLPALGGGTALNGAPCLDVLRLGNVIDLRMANTPVSSELYLPFMMKVAGSSSEYMYKTRTKYEGTEHFITFDEVRQLVGKRITIFNNTQLGGQTFTLMTGPRLYPIGKFASSPLQGDDTVYDVVKNGTSIVENYPLPQNSFITLELTIGEVATVTGSLTNVVQCIFWRCLSYQSTGGNIGGTTTFTKDEWDNNIYLPE